MIRQTLHFLFSLVIVVSVLGATLGPASAGITIERKLESLCGDCSVMAQQWVQNRFPFKNETDPRPVYVFIPPGDGALRETEDVLFAQYVRQMRVSSLGRKFLSVIDGSQMPIYFRLFYHLTSMNDEAFWVDESRQPHDLFGYAYSSDQAAVVALNNYQQQHIGLYTFVHELCHVLDPARGSIDSSDPLAPIILEYRALLAEVTFYQEYKKAIESSGQLFEKSTFHEKFLKSTLLFGPEKIDRAALFQFALNSLFPTDELGAWIPVSNGTSAPYLRLESLLKSVLESPEALSFESISYTQNAEMRAALKAKNQIEKQGLEVLVSNRGLKSQITPDSALSEFNFPVGYQWKPGGSGPKGRDGGN